MTAPSKWNFWSRYDSVLYGIRAYHPRNPKRVIFAYGGKTIQRPWTLRITQHLWGGTRHNSTAQPWADTVIGWTPNGTVQQVIDAGGVFIIYRNRCSPFGLWWREILMIWFRRPYYNYQWNQGNTRRITKKAAKQQRVLRDRGLVAAPPLWPTLGEFSVKPIVMLVGLLTLVGMFFPGMPGAVGIQTGMDLLHTGREWVETHHNQMIGYTVLTIATLAAVRSMVTPRRRSRR